MTQAAAHVRVVLHPALMAGLVLTAAGLVALAAQDLPILVVDDLGMIGLGLVALAATATIAAAGRAREGTPPRIVVGAIAALAVAIAVLATAGYKLFADGRGWPTWRLALGPVHVGLAAALGHGLGRLLNSAPRSVAVLSSVVVAIVGVAPAGVAMTELAKRRFDTASEDDCVTKSGVRYCAIEGFQPLVDDWAFVVERVLEQAPQAVADRARGLPVVQRGSDADTGGARALASPLLGWGRPGGVGEGNAQAALALGVARMVVGADGSDVTCGQPAAAHEVVIWWLAGQVSPGAARQVAGTGEFADNLSGTNYAAGAAPSVEASRYAAQLLRQPKAEVGRRLRERWERFTDPATPATELAETFELAPIEAPEGSCD